MKAPFPYFGGKTKIGPLVWQALGQPKHYIEPFCGSCAVLLARPHWQPGSYMETVNDKDMHIANAWRAMQADPDAVAKVCDWPVNHADLNARRHVLDQRGEELRARLIADPKAYDAEMAGYWIWCQCVWIGSGMTRPDSMPHLSHSGMGIHALGPMPHLTDGGMGIHALGKRPHLTDGGKGIHALGQRPNAPDLTKDVREPYNTRIYEWFRKLSERLRYVRVVCGDWKRVCGGDWQDDQGVCGMFFDPPYGGETGRDPTIYSEENLTVAQEVADWCLERGDRKTYRIVLAGYYEEHERLLSLGWRVTRWKANSGYANQGGDNQNRRREALFMSPHCLSPHDMPLFTVEER